MSWIFYSPDFLVLYLKHLPLGEVAKCRLICKRWNEIISFISGRAWYFWRMSYEAFVKKLMSTLDGPYRILLSRGVWNVDFTLDIVRLFSKYRFKRHFEIFVKEGMMTGDQLENVRRISRTWAHGDDYLKHLLCDSGIIALRERLITIEQVIAMPTTNYLTCLLNFNGIAALREHLITPEQVIDMSHSNYVGYLFDNNYGIVALREGLITPKQIRDMPNFVYLLYLFKNVNGITALRERLITPEQVAAMPSANYVESLFLNVNGITALRKGLITPEQVASLPSAKYAGNLFYEDLDVSVFRLRLQAGLPFVNKKRTV